MYLMNQKQSLDSDTCIIMLDFAENILAAFTQLLL